MRGAGADSALRNKKEIEQHKTTSSSSSAISPKQRTIIIDKSFLTMAPLLLLLHIRRNVRRTQRRRSIKMNVPKYGKCDVGALWVADVSAGGVAENHHTPRILLRLVWIRATRIVSFWSWLDVPFARSVRRLVVLRQPNVTHASVSTRQDDAARTHTPRRVQTLFVRLMNG